MTKEFDCRLDVEKLLNGDNNISSKLYKEIYAYLKKENRLYRIQDNDIKDIVQNAMLKLLLNLTKNKFRYESTLSTYAISIAKRHFFKFLNRKEGELKISDPNLLDMFVKEEPELFDFNDNRWTVYNIEYKNLKKECRRLLRFVAHKHTYEYIAKKMGYNIISLVKEKVYRCKKRLIKLMENNALYQ